MFLVWSFVRRKASVAVDAEHALLRRANMFGRKIHEFAIDFFNQRQQRRFQFCFIHLLAGIEPVATIIARQTAQKLNSLRREMRRHRSIVKKSEERRQPGERGPD